MNNRLSKGDLPWYQANINNYVNQIDLFVLALQHYAERKMLLVVAISTAGGIGIFTLVFYFGPHTPSGGCPAESAGYRQSAY